ncbi:hypothetical protein BDV96DRAFT_561033 [Lophiotrema nucula]|uniref:Uncharacterized protein n=1 Tax=Lophiotrema nucula TaxID=690887 RepID=A0A6A5ZWE6_9PLEO|nr:hypothetical protein BDV96DRAFT_561033 [Lophiotrema nucula]
MHFEPSLDRLMEFCCMSMLLAMSSRMHEISGLMYKSLAVEDCLIMSTYKALIVEAQDKPMVLKDLPVPTVTTGSVLVSPLYSLLPPHAGWLYQNPASDRYFFVYPFTPGISAVARVEEVPSDATSLKKGDIVWVDSTILGRDDRDAAMLVALHGGTSDGSRKLMRDTWRHGHWAEKALMPLEIVYKIPEALYTSIEDGGKGFKVRDFAMSYYPMLALGGLSDANVGPGSTVIVLPSTGKFSGGGVLVALGLGAKVIAAGRNEEGLKKLYQFPGAKERLTTVKLVSDAERDAAALKQAAGGKGADVFLDYSPSVASGPDIQSNITAGIKALRRGGQLVLLGAPTADVSVNYFTTVLNNITVKGKFMYEREHIERYFKLLEQGHLKTGTEVGMNDRGNVGLEDWAEGFNETQKWKSWGDDMVIAPNGEL